jgi:hypothetical protein
MHYFGSWEGGRQAALNKYQEQKDDLHAGRKPRAGRDGLTLRELLNRFLTAKKMHLDAGEISPRTFADYKTTTDRISAAFGLTRLVDDLASDDFDAGVGERPQRRCQGDQREGGNGRRIADVPRRVPKPALPHPGERLLRVEGGGQVETAAPHPPARRRPVRVRGAVGPVGQGRRAGEVVRHPHDHGSYARLVRCAHASGGKKLGSGGKKIGNPHRRWAFAEAACLFVRQSERAKKWLHRQEKKRGQGKALAIRAAQLGRAVYHLLVKKVAVDEARFWGS